MSRLFITEREINFINDIGKELTKDVVGQKIYYFSISNIKSQVHDVYEESPDKIFEKPIEAKDNYSDNFAWKTFISGKNVYASDELE
jgi:hypothetical protein